MCIRDRLKAVERRTGVQLEPGSKTYQLMGQAAVQMCIRDRDQVVRIYSFEATGNGDYQIEAGLEYNKHARAVSTALGYNQLLGTNSVEIVAEDGNKFAEVLHTQAAQLPADQRQTCLLYTSRCV